MNYMDFMEFAIAVVPALTGMDLFVYNGSPDLLIQFENKCCFSPELQPIYTQKGLVDFLKSMSREFVYDIEDALGMRLIVVRIRDYWVLLGPFVEKGGNEQTIRHLLAESGMSETFLHMYKTYRCKFPVVQPDYAIRTALVIVEQLNIETLMIKHIQLTRENRNSLLTFSDVYANTTEINRRDLLEDYYISAIICGDAAKAIKAREERNKTTYLAYFNDSRQDRLVSATIERTIVRIAAKFGGLSPVLIDTIIQEFAQQMCFTSSQDELDRLIKALIERICSEIQKQRKLGYSLLIRQAIDYMETNLSKPLTTTEVAQAVGLERKSFVGKFRKETKKTVKEYLANRRCEIAAQLLVGSKASIQDVATYVGYSDNNYFTKVFKANTGVTPQVYRSIHSRPEPEQ